MGYAWGGAVDVAYKRRDGMTSECVHMVVVEVGKGNVQIEGRDAANEARANGIHRTRAMTIHACNASQSNKIVKSRII